MRVKKTPLPGKQATIGKSTVRLRSARLGGAMLGRKFAFQPTYNDIMSTQRGSEETSRRKHKLC